MIRFFLFALPLLIQAASYTDPITGAPVTEFTAPGQSASNLYYHFPNFTADSRYAVYTSGGQIHAFEPATGISRQLTTHPQTSPSTACPDPRDKRRIFFLQAHDVMALDIESAQTRKIASVPPPILGGPSQPSLSHDGRSLALSKRRDNTTWEIGLIDIATGTYRTVLTQGFHIGHVQHSPTDPVIFYVWETGGYAPQRTWLVNSDGAGNRPFYFRTDPKAWFTPLKEWVTHEAWVQSTGEMTMVNDKVGVMLVSKDGTSQLLKEGRFWHAAATPDGKRLVLDDFDGRLWLLETATGNLRLLATGLRDTHRQVHAHASFDWSGRYVLFNSGRTHPTVAIIDLQSLPE
ncbi:MAG: hypothetical protein JNK48_19190 [Bryobacterales bacterium]|nr:hypothetical protein [Bryobacterales bacterium]